MSESYAVVYQRFFYRTRKKRNYTEWIESYYARDIQELFNVRNRSGFLNLLYLMFMQSGGMLEVTSLSREIGLSRPTVMSHLEALNIARAMTVVPSFFGGGKKEIVKRPKVYGFDTGFVTLVKGWNQIRESDRELLWEHLVLDMLRVSFGEVHYWTDKGKNEIDFIVKGKGSENHTIECKINPDKYSDLAVKKFRTYYPEGKNCCFSPHVKKPAKFAETILE